MLHFYQFVQSFVGDGDDTYIGLDGAKGEIGCLGLGITQAVEQS
jgi:hypothetical protein